MRVVVVIHYLCGAQWSGRVDRLSDIKFHWSLNYAIVLHTLHTSMYGDYIKKHRRIPKSKRAAVSSSIRKEYREARAGTAHSGRNGPLVHPANHAQIVAIGINKALGSRRRKKK